MGRTMRSFRIGLAIEEKEWKPFRDKLDRSDRQLFDEMFDLPRLYLSACSYSAQTVRLYPILMSILLCCFKQLVECSDEICRLAIALDTKYDKELEENVCWHEPISK